MSWQTVDILEVIEIHKAIIQRAKTRGSVRDFSLLHSAVERPKASFQGQDLYPTIFLKASALLQSLCLNHPFTDGNKRTAWMATKRFLAVNDYHLKADKIVAADFMVWVDNGKPELSKISSWLRRHAETIDR